MADKLLTSLRRTLVTVNIFFVIAGFITLYLGISVILTSDRYGVWPPGLNLPPFIIGIAVIILLLAVIGFYGALRENYLITIVFAGATVIVLLLQLSACVASFALRGQMLDAVHNQLSYGMNLYSRDADVAEQWNKLQKDFKCCGATGPNEWPPILNTAPTLIVPMSCCNHSSGPVADCTVFNAYTRGCSDLLETYVGSKMDAVGFGGAFLTLMQGLIVVNIISALWLVRIAKTVTEE